MFLTTRISEWKIFLTLAMCSTLLAHGAFGACPTTFLGPIPKLGPSINADGTGPGNSSGVDQEDPTAEKPQSKLWYAPGAGWFAVMWDSREWDLGGQRFRIHRYSDDSDENGWEALTTVDDLNADTDRPWLRRYDVVYYNNPTFEHNEVYIASHEIGASASCSGGSCTCSGLPAGTCDVRVYRFKAVPPQDGWWDLDEAAGFPKTLKTFTGAALVSRVESLVIEKAENNVLWATWTKVDSGGGNPGPQARVHLARTVGACAGSSIGSNCEWYEIAGACAESGQPCGAKETCARESCVAGVCTGSGADCSAGQQCPNQGCSFPAVMTNISTDDISSLIAFRRSQGDAPFFFKNTIGVMWSDQNEDEAMYFAVHDDDWTDLTWWPTLAYEHENGKGADDHINLKRSAACTQGNPSTENQPCQSHADCGSPDAFCFAHRILAATKTSRADVVGDHFLSPRLS